MKTLLIETSTEKSCICLIDGDKVIYLPLDGGPELSKRLALEVSILLKKNDFHPNQIAVGQGPGSFTGIRVGAALALSLGFGWSIPVLEFCSPRIFAPPKEESIFAVLIDARMGGVHILIGEEATGQVRYKEPKLIPSSEELKALIRDIPCLLSPHPHLIQKRVERTCLEAQIHLSEQLPQQSLINTLGLMPYGHQVPE